MITPRVTDKAEKIFMVVKNVNGATITTGMAVALAIGGNSFDGFNAVLAASGTTANLPGFIGVANKDIAVNDKGLVLCWGFAGSVLLSHTGTSVTINQGDPLAPGALAGGVTSLSPTYAASGNKYIIASNVPVAASVSGYISGLVRCL